MTDNKTSSIGLILRTKKTKVNPYGAKPVERIPADDVCVVYLGGNGSRTDKEANGNAKIVDNELVSYLKTKVDVYAVRYDFSDEDAYGQYARYRYLSENFLSSAGKFSGESKQELSLTTKNVTYEFKRYLYHYLVSDAGTKRPLDSIEGNLRGIKIYLGDNPGAVASKLNALVYASMEKLGYSRDEADTIWNRLENNIVQEHSEYIEKLFNATLLPRISDNGKRLPLDVAQRRVRKINFVAHCHGAYVAKKLEEKARTKMHELGYSPREIKDVLAQMLVVAHAPSCNFNNSDALFVSFMSAFDTIVDTPVNWVKAYIDQMRKQDIKYMVENKKTDIKHRWLPRGPVFLDKKHGNMFLIARGFDFNLNTASPSSDEHDNTHYDFMDKQNELNLIAADILSSGIENSLRQSKKFVPLPSIPDLMCRPDTDANTIKKAFESMKRDGNKFIADVYSFASEKVKKLRSDKPVVKKTQNTYNM